MRPARNRLRPNDEIRVARLVLPALLVVAVAADARAFSGFQIGRDGGHSIISRDVLGARWAIVEDRADGILIGNVFFPDGSPPQFVWCEPITLVENKDPAQASYTYDCFGSSTCVADEGCPDWVFISTVELSGSFFEAPPLQASPVPTPTGTPNACPTPGTTATPAPTATAQPTPKPTATPKPTSTPKPSPAPTPEPTASPVPTATPTPKPTPSPKPPALVITPSKATVTMGGTFLFVVTGGVPPYTLHVTTGGSVSPSTVTSAGGSFVFTPSASGAATIIVVDASTTLQTVDVSVKPAPTPVPAPED